MPCVLIGLNKADMFMVFIGSFVCKIRFQGHSSSLNPRAKAVWAHFFFTLALGVEPLKNQWDFYCQRLVLLLCSAPPHPQIQYRVREGLWGFRYRW